MSEIKIRNTSIDPTRSGDVRVFPQADSGTAYPLVMHIKSEKSTPAASSELIVVRMKMAEIVEQSVSIAVAQKALNQAEALTRDHMEDLAVRFMLLQLKELAGHSIGVIEQWADLHRDSPQDIRIVRYYARSLVRQRRNQEALLLIDACLPAVTDDWQAMLKRAELLADVRAHEESDSLFQRLIEAYDHRELRIAFAKRLGKRGLLARALEMLAPVVETLTPGSRAAQLAATQMDDYAFYRRFESESELAGQDIKIVAMKHAIRHFRHRAMPLQPADQPISVALLTGSLGAGGAERQLSRLACHLQQRDNTRHQNQHVDTGTSTFALDAVEVIVRQHTEPAGSDKSQRSNFFLTDLLKAGVSVKEIDRLPAISATNQKIEDRDLLRLLKQLPPQVHYGITRLCPYLRAKNFNVVSLWQDGTCLIGALAALLAGTPVIHLVFRGLPPNIRRERYRPEYRILYQALAEIPGVHFVSNSQAGAKEYAQWLGMPLERFHILYNGVPDISTADSPDDAQKWQEFAKRTPDATETIGGVFRLEHDKRPLLWIKLAHRYMKRRPKARFVIVGDGRLHDNTLELARQLGIETRLLMVGLSAHVGFWYAKMDVKVLLSAFEGLPNVLIEAQRLGIGTVSTPAGGAGECFVDGATGHLLKSAPRPDLIDACDKIVALVDRARTDSTMREFAKNRAQMLFSVDAMVDTFMHLCRPSTAANSQRSTISPCANPEIV